MPINAHIMSVSYTHLPAAGLINYFRGKNLVLINKSSTSADNKADLVIHEAIGKVLGETVNNI